MSYNVDKVLLIGGSLRIASRDVLRLKKELGDRIPESCFLNKLEQAATEDLFQPGKMLDVGVPQWCGEGSGWSYAPFKAQVIPALIGEADLVFIWEGGDSTSGLRIKDGAMIECDVLYRLVPRK